MAAHDLSCGYGAEPVLAGVSLRLRAGEMVAVLGRNGSGKSTLLRCLAGVLAPLAGRVELFGRPLERLGRRAVAQTLAMVAQELQVPFAFTVREVVDLGRSPFTRFLQQPAPADRAVVAQALAEVDLLDKAGRPFNHLSGGEQQRAAVAMALAQQPRVLLLDEPTVHLDLAHQMSILALARRRCREEGVAVLAAMHDINLACLYVDRLIVLGEGTLLADGPLDAIVTPALIEHAFATRVAVGHHPELGVPQVSLLP